MKKVYEVINNGGETIAIFSTENLAAAYCKINEPVHHAVNEVIIDEKVPEINEYLLKNFLK
jgi:hypothetical protein